jgi:hypothetical protein
MSAASIAALPAPLRPTDDDWAKMLAAHVHLGTKNLDNRMVRALETQTLLGSARCERPLVVQMPTGGTDVTGGGRSLTSGSAVLTVCT